MPSITVETRIRAPIERVFDLARSVDAHLRSSSFTGERAVPPGRTSGLLEPGDTVTFEGRHLGMRQRFTVKITEMSRPDFYVDELVKSAFQKMRHVHEFVRDGEFTIMRDVLDWTSPLGIIGRIADGLFVKRHLRGYVARKQENLRGIAEGESLQLHTTCTN